MEIAEVLSNYPVGALRSITPASGGITNENWFVDTEKGNYFLRCRNPYFTPDSINFELNLIEHLTEDGFPTAPLIHTNGSQLKVERNGRYWELYARIYGEHFNPSNLAQTGSAARLLAGFHRTVASYKIGSIGTIVPDRRIDLSRVSRLIDEFERGIIADYGTLGRRLAPFLAGFFRKHARSVFTCIQPLSLCPLTLIHGDFQPSNVIFRGDDAVEVVDFGDATVFYRAYDVARALIRFSTLKPGYRSQMDVSPRMNLARVSAFMDAYQAEYPLSEIELRTFPALLRAFTSTIWALSWEKKQDISRRPK